MYKPILLFLFLSLMACQRRDVELQAEATKYPRWIGDIEPDPQLDDPHFQPCNGDNTYQYFNHSEGLQYRGEKRAIEALFQKLYRPVTAAKANGLIRIRFMVNCAGKTGRFRLISMDENYQAVVFPKAICTQLLNITKKLDGWEKLPNGEEATDYYQYLSFKIEQGAIKEILP